jgi:hypothetical protein
MDLCKSGIVCIYIRIEVLLMVFCGGRKLTTCFKLVSYLDHSSTFADGGEILS